MKLKTMLLVLIIFLIIGLILVSTTNNKKNTIVEENGTIEIYFCPQVDCNQIFVNKIIASQNVSCAFYEITDERVITALENKQSNPFIHYENFEEYGIPRKGEGLMHSKFCTLDNNLIFSGSHNPTNNENKDNILIIESKYLSNNYKNELNNFQNNLVGEEKIKTKYQHIIFNGYELENYFCPQDNCEAQILEELYKANSSIYFMTFTFTNDDIANALINKKMDGLEVRGIIESYQGRTYWVYPELIEANIPVILDNEKSLQHNKIFIIDNKTVITGSFNPTKSADTKNDENILIINQPDIVEKYVLEFEKLSLQLKS